MTKTTATNLTYSELLDQAARDETGTWRGIDPTITALQDWLLTNRALPGAGLALDGSTDPSFRGRLEAISRRWTVSRALCELVAHIAATSSADEPSVAHADTRQSISGTRFWAPRVMIVSLTTIIVPPVTLFIPLVAANLRGSWLVREGRLPRFRDQSARAESARNVESYSDRALDRVYIIIAIAALINVIAIPIYKQQWPWRLDAAYWCMFTVTAACIQLMHQRAVSERYVAGRDGPTVT